MTHSSSFSILRNIARLFLFRIMFLLNFLFKWLCWILSHFLGVQLFQAYRELNKFNLTPLWHDFTSLIWEKLLCSVFPIIADICFTNLSVLLMRFTIIMFGNLWTELCTAVIKQGSEGLKYRARIQIGIRSKMKAKVKSWC